MKLAHRTSNHWLPSLIDEMFTNDYLGGTQQTRKPFTPSVNVSEMEVQYVLKMSIPGFKKEEGFIEIDKDLLTISSEVDAVKQESTEQFSRKEFGKKSFRRSFHLPGTVHLEKIDASYKNGVLGIAFPKKEEALPQPKRMIILK
jgi:HSP20 family protein